MMPSDQQRTAIESHRSGAGFSKQSRLLKSPQFRSVFDAKQSVADDNLILYGVPNGLAFNRLGLAVSRKVGNAVVRNRWKRQIREAFRLQKGTMPQGLDFVVLPRRGAEPRHATVMRSLTKLVTRIGKRANRAGGRQVNETRGSQQRRHHGRGRGKS